MIHLLSPSVGTHLLECWLLMVAVPPDWDLDRDFDRETGLDVWAVAGGVGYDDDDDGDDGVGGGDDGDEGDGGDDGDDEGE